MRLTKIAEALGRIYGIQGIITHCAWSLYILKNGRYVLKAVPDA